MNIIKQQAVSRSKNIRLVIERDENVGFYLYVYDLTTGNCIRDTLYMHDQLEDLYASTQRNYGISKDFFFPIE